MTRYHASLIVTLALSACGQPDIDGSGGGPTDAGPDAPTSLDADDGDCCYDVLSPTMAACNTAACVNGTCVVTPQPEGFVCGGDADASLHGECICGFCSWANYGADPCTGVPDDKPCRNGRGVCEDGGCTPTFVCARSAP